MNNPLRSRGPSLAITCLAEHKAVYRYSAPDWLWSRLARALGGGRLGARLCQHLHPPLSARTLIGRLLEKAQTPIPAPQVIGIDEWAYRRRHCYGTLICDLERRQPCDLLPDRNAESAAVWLRQHWCLSVESTRETSPRASHR